MDKIFIVGIGGAIGAISRYLLSIWTVERLGAGFPYGTLLANIIGCFIIGLFMTIATERLIVNPYWRLLVSVGFAGGLTTFSSFSYETFRLLQQAEIQLAFMNIAFNFMAGFLATWMGITIARLV